MRSTCIAAAIASICLGWAPPAHASVVTDWYGITVSCVFGGPTPANRGGPTGYLDMALVQISVHDAVQAIEGRFEAYRYTNPDMRGIGSVEAAAAGAAYGVLAGLYGANNPCLAGVETPAVTYAGDEGLQAGQEAAAAILPLYRRAFVSPIDPVTGGTQPGEWRPTASGNGVNAFMAYTQPFALSRPSQFRPERQPPLVSEQYTREFQEVKDYGSATGSLRSPEQTDIARFWANPPSGVNNALRAIVSQHILDPGDQARVLALANIAAADAQITVYETKYHFGFWRPETAIREADTDGNPHTAGEPTWTPLVATPAYPDYTSGANCLTAAVLTTLQLHFGTDEFEFSIPSAVQGLMTNPRVYERFSDAMQEMVEVRILQGIHFRSADEQGRRQGGRVAHWTFQKFLRPVGGRP